MDDKELVPINIDLNSSDKLSESWLLMFGGAIKYLLRSLFGESSPIPVSVRGTPSQLEAFSKTLAGEKRYMDSFYQYGLNDPKTYQAKSVLDNAIKGFESTTKVKWPFK